MFGSKVSHLATLLSPGLASFFHDVVGCGVDCSGLVQFLLVAIRSIKEIFWLGLRPPLFVALS